MFSFGEEKNKRADNASIDCLMFVFNNVSKKNTTNDLQRGKESFSIF